MVLWTWSNSGSVEFPPSFLSLPLRLKCTWAQRSWCAVPLLPPTPTARGFAFALTAVTLRHLGLLDAVVDQCLNKPLSTSKKTQSLRKHPPPRTPYHTSWEGGGKRRIRRKNT